MLELCALVHFEYCVYVYAWDVEHVNIFCA